MLFQHSYGGISSCGFSWTRKETTCLKLLLDSYGVTSFLGAVAHGKFDAEGYVVRDAASSSFGATLSGHGLRVGVHNEGGGCVSVSGLFSPASWLQFGGECIGLIRKRNFSGSLGFKVGTSPTLSASLNIYGNACLVYSCPILSIVKPMCRLEYCLSSDECELDVGLDVRLQTSGRLGVRYSPSCRGFCVDYEDSFSLGRFIVGVASGGRYGLSLMLSGES